MPQRHLKIRLYSSLVLLLSSFQFVQAKEVTVFDVRRPLAMENGEQPQKDYFLNAGSIDGLKNGMLVNVTRRQALYDPYLNKSPGDLVVSVGVLRIIHVQADMSVARLESLQNGATAPTVEFEAVMAGDKVDLSSARMAKKTASLEGASPVMPAAEPLPAMAAPAGSSAMAPAQQPDGRPEKDFSSITEQVVAPKASVNVNTTM